MNVDFDEKIFLMKVVLLNLYFTGSEWASGAQRFRHGAGAVVPDPFVCFARPALPDGALGLLTPKPALFARIQECGFAPAALLRAAFTSLREVSQCEGAYGGLCATPLT